ncbi:Na /Pi symporter [Phaffia rhodozyma]|uniref:Phosphate transporter n=1 Tax=Phaffia rhodozyma TaxID=264483 RepID=A0A0F7SKG0_PHARH|nr:Na /Pi symporter [Phaffia rhodozyma]
MPTLHEYDFLFVFGLIFAFLDAYGIGANDVANSFATAIASKSLTFKQAIVLGGLCEFLGALLLGAKVTDTIRTKIIDLTLFEDNAPMLMLAMVCALVGSSVWLTIATRLAMPVSTTHSITGAIVGVGIAAGGGGAVNWTWNGLGKVFASWVVAPLIAGGFACIIFLITKYGVLRRVDQRKAVLVAIPCWFFVTASVLTMSIIWKGAPALGLDKLPNSTIVPAILLTGFVIAILSIVYVLPYAHQQVHKKDYNLRPYHFILGPFVMNRPSPDQELNPNNLSAKEKIDANKAIVDEEKSCEGLDAASSGSDVINPSPLNTEIEKKDKVDPSVFVGHWALPANLWRFVRYRIPKVLLTGWNTDLHDYSTEDKDQIERLHAAAEIYGNDTEHYFTYLQVLTACTASFAHGSNDVANAIGPLSTIYLIWSSGSITGSKAPVPTWILAYGGIGIVIGLATYGYHIMRVLGNRITLVSPSRGFSMELGAAITVVLASQFALPVSTTQCIVGATCFVGLMNFEKDAVSWPTIRWIFMSWLLTLPCAGLMSGILFGIIINCPRF